MRKNPVPLNIFDFIFLATIFVGLTFVLLLFLTKRLNRKANVYLGIALLIMVLWMVWVLAIDIHLGDYFPKWSWIPLQYSLTLGPVIYFYVLRLTQPQRRFKGKDFWHFSPIIIEQGVQVLQVAESHRTGQPTYNTIVFSYVNPVIQLLALISIFTYLLTALRLLRKFHLEMTNNFSNEKVYQYRWLKRLLAIFCILWLLWIPFDAVDYLYFDYKLGIESYYPLYLLLAGMTIWISAEAFLRPEIITIEVQPPVKKAEKEMPGEELILKTAWLKQQMESNLYYLDAALSLRSLAEQLDIHPNELSRITNLGLGKSFSDFVNEHRVGAVIKKMQDPSFDPITLLGIAFDSGFNSKTTFNRIFKELTGKTPAAYKQSLQTGAIM